ncbi:MAG: hypothetical protein ACJ796_05580 [Gemmatimonadaceae bacterium]
MIAKIDAPGLELREVQDVIDEGEQVALIALHALQVRELRLCDRPTHSLDDEIRVAANRIERQVPWRHPVIRRHLPVTRILGAVMTPMLVPQKVGAKIGVGRGWPKFSNAERGAPHSVERVNFSPCLSVTL